MDKSDIKIKQIIGLLINENINFIYEKMHLNNGNETICITSHLLDKDNELSYYWIVYPLDKEVLHYCDFNSEGQGGLGIYGLVLSDEIPAIKYLNMIKENEGLFE